MVTGVCIDADREAECLLAGGTRARDEEGDLAAGRDLFDAAFQAADRVGNAEAMAQAALGAAGIWLHERRTLEGSATLQSRLRRVSRLIDPGSATGIRVRARLAAESDYVAGEYAKILALVDEAASVEDPVAGTEVRSLAHHCLLGPDHLALRRELAADMLEQAARSPRRVDMLMATMWQTVDTFLEGDPSAPRRLGELRQSLQDRDHLAVGFVAGAMEVMLTIRAGRLSEAESLAERCAARGAAAGDVDSTGWSAAQLIAIRWYQGRLPELLPMLGELVTSPTLSAVDNSFSAAYAVACAQAGKPRTAASVVASLRGRGMADLPRSSTWLVTMNGLAEAAYLLDDAETAARVYELLKPFADLPMLGSLAVVCFGSVEHALGVASLTMGDLDAAVTHLHAAVQRNLALAHWPAVVAAKARYAQALDRRGAPGDAELARSQRHRAAHDAAAIGIPVPFVHADSSAPTVVTCRRQGNHWRLAYGGRSVAVSGSVGLLHLAVLTANPGTEIHSADLAAGVAGLGAALVSGERQSVLDPTAIEQFRARLAELDKAADESPAWERQNRAADVRAERDWLTAELRRSTGLAGRARSFQDSPERARIAVGKAIRRAVQHIEAKDPVIAAHLRASVHTGMRCVYRPAPAAATTW